MNQNKEVRISKASSGRLPLSWENFNANNNTWRLTDMRIKLLLVAVMAFTLFATACSGDAKEKLPIKFSDTQFESLWINNAIAQFVIEHGYGYPVESVELTTPLMQVALAEGDVDIMMELWQQNFIDNYNEEIAKGSYINIGPTYEGGPQFFVIPKATADEHNIRTIDDLKKNWKLFEDPEDSSKGEFHNCPIGWQCAEINRAKIFAYGMDEFFNIKSGGSAAALDAALVGAQKKNNPVVGYYWAPTSIMGAYEWQVIEEPLYTEACWAEVAKGQDDATYIAKEACAYEVLPIDKGIHKSLPDRAPEVVEMLEKMNVGLQPINVTAAWAVDAEIQGVWEKAAIYYLNNYEDRWTTWMPAENAKKIKEALAAK
jgi:glycine betaine/proline transport system substrate-binding protein